MLHASLVPFASWQEVLTYAQGGGALYYRAPLNVAPFCFLPAYPDASPRPLTYRARARTIRMWPYGSIGRGKVRTADPFTVNAAHLDRLSRPAPIEPDVTIEGSGLYTIATVTERARTWADRHLSDGPRTHDSAGRLVCDDGPACRAIVAAMVADGLRVTVNGSDMGGAH